jgi:osmotically-inducible protein OsmY
MEDKQLALQVRHMMVRSPLDLSGVQVTCSKGSIELVGMVKRPRDFRGDLDMKKEVAKLKQVVALVRGVTDVYSTQLRIQD